MWLAISSGVLGALAAAVGKLSLSEESLLVSAAQSACSPVQDHSLCSLLGMGVRGGGFLVMLGLNAGMMRLLLLALTKGSTAYVTLSATSSNFVLSVRQIICPTFSLKIIKGILGGLLFGEPMTVQWAMGLALIVIGMGVLKIGHV